MASRNSHKVWLVLAVALASQAFENPSEEAREFSSRAKHREFYKVKFAHDAFLCDAKRIAACKTCDCFFRAFSCIANAHGKTNHEIAILRFALHEDMSKKDG